VASWIVVGGGVAGLCSAWSLRRAGHEVEVLERESTPGGRARSEVRGEFCFDHAAPFSVDPHGSLLELARELGIEDRLELPTLPRSSVLRGGRLYPADFTAPLSLIGSGLLSPSAKLHLLSLATELLRKRRQLDPLHPELAAPLDGETLEAGLRRRVGKEAFEFLFAPVLSAWTASAVGDLSLASALVTLNGFLRGAQQQTFAGSSGLLVESLSQQIRVRPRCDVFTIETETAGARIRYRARGRERSVLADGVVVALPGCEVARLCPKLTPDERGFFEEVRYARTVSAHLFFEKAPRTLPGWEISFPRSAGSELSRVVAHHAWRGAAPPGAGLLGATFAGAEAERLWRQKDEAVAQTAIEALARTPVGREEPFEVVVRRNGALLPQFSRGHLGRLARFLGRMERSPRMAFAGDYLVAPSLEGAVTSGLRVASEIERER